jgi:hypothetical protein
MVAVGGDTEVQDTRDEVLGIFRGCGLEAGEGVVVRLAAYVMREKDKSWNAAMHFVSNQFRQIALGHYRARVEAERYGMEEGN